MLLNCAIQLYMTWNRYLVLTEQFFLCVNLFEHFFTFWPVYVFQNGFLSALPYLGCWILALFGGQLADFLRETCLFRTVVVRKVFTLVGEWGRLPLSLFLYLCHSYFCFTIFSRWALSRISRLVCSSSCNVFGSVEQKLLLQLFAAFLSPWQWQREITLQTFQNVLLNLLTCSHPHSSI